MALVYSDTKQNRGVIHLSVGGCASMPLPAYTNEKGLPAAAPLVVGILGEETLSLLFEQEAAKRSKNGVWGISRLRARRGLRALDLRKLLKKFDQNFFQASVFYDYSSSIAAFCVSIL
ncbi:MAG: hypothetical protein J6S28_02695 [Clostridia bacterium]|nr:hypothetical protein [Clostridia bacterium]